MRFSDLGITIERDNYTDPKVSINDLLNVNIKVLGFKPNVNTANGKRHLVRIETDGQTRVFFTASTHIMQVLEHEKIRFPFETVIKSYKIGDKRGYEFS